MDMTLNIIEFSISGSTAFANICQSLLTRMIETVPTGTQFTDEVQLNPFKIRFAQITPIAGQLVLRVMVRVRPFFQHPRMTVN